MPSVRALPDLVSRLVIDTSGLKKAEAEATAASNNIGKKMAMAGAAIGVAVVASAVGIGIAAVKMAKDFQTSTETLVTGAGESQKALESVRQGILKLAPAVGVGPEQLVKALFMINSAGYHGAEGLKILESAAEGAKVGNADLGTTANAVTTVMKDYHMAATDAADATNFLVSVVSQGKTHMEDLAFSLAAILPTASALGVPLAQVGGALATLTARGVPAADAATYLRFTLSALAGETPKGKKALESIGLTALQVGDTLTHKGLLPALELIQEQLTKKFPKGGAAMFATLKDITGGTRGLGAALGLTGAQLDTFIAATANVTASMKGSKGQVLGWAEIQAELNVKLDKFKGKIDAFMISLGNALLPLATAAVDALTRAFDALVTVLSGKQGANDKIDQMAGKAAMAAAATGDSSPDGLASSIEKVTSGLTAFFNAKSTKDFIKFWNDVADAVSTVASWLNTVDSILNNIVTKENELGKSVRQGGSLFLPSLATIGGAGGVLGPIGRLIPHQTGIDYVPFDNYPALLHKGERVQTAQQAQGGGGGGGESRTLRQLLAETQTTNLLLSGIARKRTPAMGL